MVLNPCCCISPRTGAIIIGVLELIGNIILMFLALIAYAGLSYIQTMDDPDLKEKYTQDVTKEFKTYPGYEDADAEKIFSLIILILIYVLVACIINLVLASILIHGIRKERPRLILAYLIVNGIHLALEIVAMIFNETLFAMVAGSGVLGIILSIYFLIVVYAAYVETRNNLLQGQNQAVIVKYEHA